MRFLRIISWRLVDILYRRYFVPFRRHAVSLPEALYKMRRIGKACVFGNLCDAHICIEKKLPCSFKSKAAEIFCDACSEALIHEPLNVSFAVVQLIHDIGKREQTRISFVKKG